MNAHGTEKVNQTFIDSTSISTIAKVFNVSEDEITDIKILKKGMTNRLFSFICKSEKYIIRIPGEGTNQLINRENEARVYHTIKAKGIY